VKQEAVIIGAGMAGLLAANLIGKKRPVTVMERAASLPNNHTALLRFRTSIVGDVCDIPFKKVKVIKTVAHGSNDVADILQYSKKVSGEYSARSIISTLKTEIADRYIAPGDLVAQLHDKANCTFNFEHELTEVKEETLIYLNDVADLIMQRTPIISTMPMPTMMDLLGYQDRPKFNWRAGYTVSFDVKSSDVYASVYIPNPEYEAYRISITGKRVIVEYVGPSPFPSPEMVDEDELKGDAIAACEEYLGIPQEDIEGIIQVRAQLFAKIAPIEEEARRSFILWASLKHNVYSLGRFATWRPGLMMDDVVNDIRVIDRLMGGHSMYEQLLRS
jgi:hypothetical protein